MSIKNLFVLLFSLFIALKTQAQLDSSLTFSGYVDVYYSYDMNEPANNTKPGFLYNHTRHNEVNINVALLKAAYQTSRVRANVALMVGTYPEANLAAEPSLLKNVYEANAGVKVSKNHNLWFDAGIFTSHIGIESAISKDCWTVTRSIVAENSPYYQSGAKLTYITKNDKWTASLLYLNGWQRIRRLPGNNYPAGGTQIVFKPNDKITLNYSTFFGSDKPDSLLKKRFYHDFYLSYQVSDKFSIIAYVDYGMEQASKDSSVYYNWFSPVVKIRYAVSPKVFLTLRGEYFDDQKEVIIATGTTNGFQVLGASLNIDYSPYKNVHCRIEGRYLEASDQIFMKHNKAVSNNGFITSSIAVAF